MNIFLARLFPTYVIALGAKIFKPNEYKQLDNG
jgi:hypothetical protein